ncbi:MAG: hypothetical protein EG824_01160 [Deltaproteobacteria bacterium]|nr:hypothetical protein [Deltaproteobacteria bacterium]
MRPAIYSLSSTERSSFFLPALTVSSSILIWLLVRKFDAGLLSILRELAGERNLVIAAVVSIAMLVVFAVGHVLDLISHSVYERFLSDKLDGYPHERIVPLAHTTIRYKMFIARKRTNMRRPGFLYEGVKALICAGSIFVLAGLILRYPRIASWPHFIQDSLGAISLYCLIVAITALLLAFPMVFVSYAPWGTYESRRRFAITYSWRLSRLRRRDGIGVVVNWVLHWTFLFILAPFAFAYDIADRLIRELLRLNKEVDLQTYENVLRVAKINLKVTFSEIRNNDRFWLPYLYVLAHGGDAARLVANGRKKASFYRNQALACVISSLVLGSAYQMSQQDVSGFLTRADVIRIAIMLYFLGWMFHWKFLQQYYGLAKTVFRIFATLPERKVPAKARAKLEKDRPA